MAMALVFYSIGTAGGRKLSCSSRQPSDSLRKSLLLRDFFIRELKQRRRRGLRGHHLKMSL